MNAEEEFARKSKRNLGFLNDILERQARIDKEEERIKKLNNGEELTKEQREEIMGRI